MKDYYFEVVNKEKFRGMITEVCYEYGLTYMDTIHVLVGGSYCISRQHLIKDINSIPTFNDRGHTSW